MILSQCCSAPPWGDDHEYAVCAKCKQHCTFTDEEQWEMLEPSRERAFSPVQEAIIEGIIAQHANDQEGPQT